MLLRVLAAALLSIALVACGGGSGDKSGGGPPAAAACNDGLDNDGDTLIDMADPGCTSTSDNNEVATFPACSDGLDNDGDAKVDFPADPGCSGANSSMESPQCNDALDNDGDTLVDLADPGCSGASDNNEVATFPVCSDGIDNDGDTKIDFPADPGCVDANSADEAPQCNDGLDNDGDTKVDLADSDCASASDATESPVSSTTTINFSTYLGSNAHDFVRDVAVDANGNVYAVGGAESNDLPTTAGTAQPTFGGYEDAFVAKFNGQGQLLWSTFLGGAELDRAYAVEVVGNDVIVAGRAGASFPITPGVIQPQFQGSSTVPNIYPQPQDGFVAKLNATNGTLRWSTFFGAANDSHASIIRDVAVDPATGFIYLAASTEAGGVYTNAVLNAFQNGHQSNQRGGIDGVLAKLSSDGTTMPWATYVGGSADESAQPAVRVDSQGRPVILFTSQSSNAPTTAGASDRSLGGVSDFYVAKYELNGQLTWATFVGGNNGETAETHNMAIRNDDALVIAGASRSTDFTATVPAPYDATQNGNGSNGTGQGTNYGSDCAIAVLAANGGSLLGATYYGGAVGEACEGVGVDVNRNVYVTGGSFSANLPTTAGAYQTSRPGAVSPFIAVFNNDLTKLRYGSYYGGSGNAVGRDLAVHSEAHFVFGGEIGVGWPLKNAARSTVSAADLHGGVADVTVPLGPG